MAYGFQPVLPLQRDDEDGFYVLTKTLAQNVKQNFKNLILTCPGERVMMPDFGAGIRRFLYENNTFEVQGKIQSAIDEQVATHMPFLSVDQLTFFEAEPEFTVSTNQGNTLSVQVFYSIPTRNLSDMLTI